MRKLLLALLLTSHAEPAFASPTTSTSTFEESEPEAPQTAPSVVVTFVGPLAQDPSLKAVIDELLAAQGEPFELFSQQQLSEAEVLDSPAGMDNRSIRIWVTLPSAAHATLFFSAPSLGKYLLRQLPLSQGLDAVAKEQLGQIIQSSAMALRQGTQALDRADAQRAFREQEIRLRSTAADPSPKREDRSVQARRSTLVTVHPIHFATADSAALDRVNTFTPRPLLGVGYGLTKTSQALAVRHGPHVELGVALAQKRHILGMKTALEWHFPLHYSEARAQLELQSKTAWLLLSYADAHAKTVGFAALFGAGTEFTKVAPKVNQLSAFVPRRAYTDLAYLLRIAAGAHSDFAHLGLYANVGLDVSMSKTEYHIDSDQGRSALLSLSILRPSLQLGGFIN